jgi:uncharacterized membrane protein YeaQ/YmgE (transglycosylase-associated protein family)
MSLLLALIVGVAIGTIGGFLLQENFDLLLLNCLMGVAGAILGGAVYFFSDSAAGYLLFSWSGALASVVGALLFVLIFSALHRAAPEKPSPDLDDKT